MRRFTVTILDTTGIQSYIYGSNRLRENIGASYLVAQATDNWARDALNKLATKINQKVYPFDSKKHEPDAKPYIEDGALAAELVYAGGGNTVLLFSDRKYAVQFTQILSKRILEDAPGVNLVVVHQDFDWDSDSLLYEVVQDLMKNQLDLKKRERIPSAPLLGLGVTADCTSTRLVAVDTSNQHGAPTSYPVSREIVAKLDAVDDARKHLEKTIKTIFDPKVPNKYKFPIDFDDFGRSEDESSYIAVVHADGNGMGKRFQKHGEGRTNREYITAMRELSHNVNQAGENALKVVAKAVVNSIVEVDENGKKVKKVKGQFAIKENFVPFRPLVYGGDDVTFVCDGRLGLELAAIYLQEFGRENEELEKQKIVDSKPLRACAGVCIVKVHYPFARAYALSEALCKEAKKFVKDAKKNDFSALDWHIAASGLLGSISEIRKREYKVPTGNLVMRPVSLKKERDSDWRTWEGFIKVVKELNEEEAWKGRRNKVIALREVLRGGMEATEEFLRNYRLEKLPSFPEFSGQSENLARKGWLNKICGYFDAIEVMEFYISLKEDNGSSLSTENQITE